MTKRILLICPWFPPQNLSAARRAAAFAKYLPEFGWQEQVLTACFDEDEFAPIDPAQIEDDGDGSRSRVIRVRIPGTHRRPSRGVQRALTGLWRTWSLPGSLPLVWARAVLPAADSLEFRPDLIWATFPHFGPFIVAARLSKKLGVPWIADYRDIPDEYASVPRLVRRLEIWREHTACRTARTAIAVTRAQVQALKRRLEIPVTLIPNGYDPQLLCDRPPSPQGRVFRIVYTGVIFGEGSAAPLITAVNELIDEGRLPRERIEIDFYGTRREDALRGLPVETLAKKPNFHEHVPKETVIRVQRQATVLLVLLHFRSRGIFTTKLFEYMAAGRPVLAYPRDETGVDGILTTTGIGRSCDSKHELKEVILDWYRQWEASGDIRLSRKPDEIKKWSRREQAGQLARLCDDLAE